MPEFIPHDLAEREHESYRLVNSPSPGDTAIAVTNPDGSLIGSSGGTGNVNIAQVGGTPVSSPLPISATSLPLPANAAKETGGNLDLIGTLAVENGGNLTSIQTNTANSQTLLSAHLPSIDNNTTTIATDSGNIATSTSSSSTSLMEIALDTDNLVTIKNNQTNGTQVTSVNNFPATQPVSGTVAATQSGTWTVQPGNTQNTTNWLTQTYQQTDLIYNGTTALTPLKSFANIAASTTDGSIVAAVATKKIRVLAFMSQAGATATNITFNSKPAGAGTAISMTYQNGANGGEVGGYNPLGWFETNVGEGLSATTGAGSTTGVQVVYVTV